MADKKIIVGSLLILFILAGTFILVSGGSILGGVVGSSDTVPKYTYECSMTVDSKSELFTPNLFLYKDGIALKDITCYNTNKECNSFFPFSIFGEKGTIRLYDNEGQVASKSFEVFSAGSTKVTLSGCSTGQGLIVRLYDNSDNLIIEKNV
jgi:hypothetical protein